MAYGAGEMKSATERQTDVLWAIHRLTCELGVPPTVRELGARIAVSSTNGVVDHLNALVRKGLVRRNPLIARAMFITKFGAHHLGVKWRKCAPMGAN